MQGIKRKRRRSIRKGTGRRKDVEDDMMIVIITLMKRLGGLS